MYNSNMERHTHGWMQYWSSTCNSPPYGSHSMFSLMPMTHCVIACKHGWLNGPSSNPFHWPLNIRRQEWTKHTASWLIPPSSWGKKLLNSWDFTPTPGYTMSILSPAWTSSPTSRALDSSSMGSSIPTARSWSMIWPRNAISATWKDYRLSSPPTLTWTLSISCQKSGQNLDFWRWVLLHGVLTRGI